MNDFEALKTATHVMVIDGEIFSIGTKSEMDERAANMEKMGFYGPDDILIEKMEKR